VLFRSGKEVYFQIIDIRHWDYKNNDWVK
jgi:hypothetical protein